MSKKKPLLEFDHVAFSIVQLEVDQGNVGIPSQRILQLVTRDGVTKSYVTESSYFKGEMYRFLAQFMEKSYDNSIMKQQPTLAPIDGGRHWVHLNDDTVNGKPQKRVSPEKFE
jgi:hypothetical protein